MARAVEARLAACPLQLHGARPWNRSAADAVMFPRRREWTLLPGSSGLVLTPGLVTSRAATRRGNRSEPRHAMATQEKSIDTLASRMRKWSIGGCAALPWMSAGAPRPSGTPLSVQGSFRWRLSKFAPEPDGRQFFELTADEMVVGRDQFCDIVLRNAHGLAAARPHRARGRRLLHRGPVEPQRHLRQRPAARRPHADQGPGPDPHLRSRDGFSRRSPAAAEERPSGADSPVDSTTEPLLEESAERSPAASRAADAGGRRGRAGRQQLAGPLSRGAQDFARSGRRARRRRDPAQDPRQPVRDFSAGVRAATSCWPRGPTATWCRGPSSIARARPGHSMTFGPISRKTALHVMSTAEALLDGRRRRRTRPTTRTSRCSSTRACR